MNKPNYILFQGNIDKLSSFSLVNRILVKGLRELGYKVVVFPTDSDKKAVFPKDIPDIYIVHGHPYDYRSSPGRFNIFILNYEYFQIKKEDEVLVNRLNNYFDLVFVSTHFVKDTLSKNGVNVPIKLLPWGVDGREYNPFAKPKKIPDLKEFNCVYAGTFTERKGVDTLVKAYLQEFSDKENVSLVIKEAMRWKHFEPWIEKVMGQPAMHKSSSPKIIHINKEDESLSGYFTAADVGVFPFRGEGFGLPILECIASGRPVIVTKGTGPMDYCSPENARFIKAKKKMSGGKLQLEPDVKHLRLLMRKAFERGKMRDEERVAVSKSVGKFTWERTIDALDSIIQQIPQKTSSLKNKSGKIHSHPIVAYTYYQKGVTSWKKYSLKADMFLKKNFKNYHSISFKDRFDLDSVDLIIGQSEYSLENFLRSTQLNPNVLKILHQEGTVLEERVRITNRERQKCGLDLIHKTPMEIWRNKLECDLSDYIIVPSSVSKNYFLECGYPERKIKILPYGIDTDKPYIRSNIDKVKFLFVGTDPFRKGIRILFEAWDQLNLEKAELICFVTQDVMLSKLLLKYLVKNSNIKLKKIVSYREFSKEYLNIDCQVLPSFEDSFSLTIGEGMGYGKPAIVSADTGISDIITHLHDGYIVKTGSVEELKEGILYFYENRKKIREMGEAAYETGKKYSWKHFGQSFIHLIKSLYGESI